MNRRGATLADDLAAFTRALADQSMRPNTIAAYERDLRGVAARAAEHAGLAAETLKLADLDDATMAAALASWAADHAPASVRRANVAWRRFLRWADEQGGPRPSHDALPPPPSAPQHPRPARSAGRDRLFAERMSLAAFGGNEDRTRWSSRDRVLVALIAHGALSVAETIGLDIDDLDTDGAAPVMRVVGRNDRLRTVPVDDSLNRAIARWLPRRTNALADLPAPRPRALLLDRRGQRLTAAQARYVVRSLASTIEPALEAADVFVALRRSAVARWRSQDVPEEAIARWLGLTLAVARRWIREAGTNPAPVSAPRGTISTAVQDARAVIELAVAEQQRTEVLVAEAARLLRDREPRIDDDEG